MPVRSLTSSVLKWPDLRTVEVALRSWARDATRERRDILLVGYMGSYARGDFGVGSDVDIIVVVEGSRLPFTSRPAGWDTTGLPVPADLLVYTREEWERLPRTGRFRQTVAKEAVWLYQAPSASSLLA